MRRKMLNKIKELGKTLDRNGNFNQFLNMHVLQKFIKMTNIIRFIKLFNKYQC